MVEEERIEMHPRERRVYWIQKPGDEKDLLVFDGGDPFGSVHIYEHKESKPAEEIRDEMRELYKRDIPEHMEEQIVLLWTEKQSGSVMYWSLKK